MINRDKINDLIIKTEDDLEYVLELSNSFTEPVLKPLDNLMKEININIIGNDDVSTETIKKYFLELTNGIYFIDAKCELFGFYDSISKSNMQLAYNKAFFDIKGEILVSGKKVTVAEIQQEAENKSIDETVLNFIYSRSYKLIKSKVENAKEMVKTLSKILSSNISDTGRGM